jgi:alpha-tubulin suppressor-like RCC1 family protein
MQKLTKLLILLFCLPFYVQAQCWESVQAGYAHSLGIKKDGSLWSWGRGAKGQLGNGDANLASLTPTRIGTATNWQAVSTGIFHSLALKKDGTIWAWGYNNAGQIGDGTFDDRFTPTQIGTDNDWQAIETGHYFCLALKKDGTLWAWGDNTNGQLGDGIYLSKVRPTKVGADNDWQFINADLNSSLAIKKDGTLWTWGLNNDSKLGYQPLVPNQDIPNKVGTDNNWLSAAMGLNHVVAVKKDGTLWSWGGNELGQLGDLTTINKILPAQVGTEKDWQSVAAGDGYSLALKKDKTIWSWGDVASNRYIGILGNGAFYGNSVPLQTGVAEWQSISAGKTYAFAIKSDASLWAWGYNDNGQLGNGSTSTSYARVAVPTVCILSAVDEKNANSVKLSPNPTLGWVNIEGIEGNSIAISIFNTMGQLIKTSTNSSNVLNISELPIGVYIVKISNAKISVAKQIIKI